MANYLRYANKGATRNQPLDQSVVDKLQFLEDMGITGEVFSGGQPAEGPNRVGSHRHDHGQAGDMRFFQGGRKLDWANDADRPIFEQIAARANAAGLGGIGAGPGYMEQGTMHIGGGSPAVWGAGGKGENAPDWLRKAVGMKIDSMPSAIGPTGASPQLPAPVDVASHPVAGVAEQAMASATPAVQPVMAQAPAAEQTMGDKLGALLFGDKAAGMKDKFGPNADKTNPMAVGLGAITKAVSQKPEQEVPIQSSLGSFENANAGRMQAAQQMMSALLANRKKPPMGMSLPGRMV